MKSRLALGLFACSLVGCMSDQDADDRHGLLRLAATSSSLSLSWTDTADNETGFEIERRTAGGTWAQVATRGVNAESYEDLGLDANTEYCYRVRAVNSAGASAYSNEACGTTLAAPDAADSDATTTPDAAAAARDPVEPADPTGNATTDIASSQATDSDAEISGGCAISAGTQRFPWALLLALLLAAALMRALRDPSGT